LPLFARLAGKAQQAVFQPSPRMRRIILATNVAETSLTIPDIRSVVDTGLARINRFDPVGGIQRLQIEPISQASARQRRGRCGGRVSEGIASGFTTTKTSPPCKPYTDPEILRTNLAGVVLKWNTSGWAIPWNSPSSIRLSRSGSRKLYRTLEEIGAIDRKRGLTEIGANLGAHPG